MSSMSASQPSRLSSTTAFAVYGTLRDDDNSGAEWTQRFLHGKIRATYGRVSGFRMFQNTTEPWPYAVPTGILDDRLRVRIITFPSDQFEAKLREADVIEEYDEDFPDNGLYYRDVVTAITDEGEAVTAVMYYVKELPAAYAWTSVLDNDWLRRGCK